ncbi:MAG: ubiquinol-cytochrome c reductase iron-sulfur subunit, partial [Candidatus Binatia bacterium]
MAKEKAAAEDPKALAERRRQEQVEERQKREREKAQRGGLWSRRDFFGRLAWGGFGAFSLVGLLAFVRSAFPRVLFVPPLTFKAGFPGDYPVGEVSERYTQEFRVWIVREPQGFYAIFAKCTHLGCTPRWAASEGKYKCPCHGSGYFKTGYNFEGPAPRP